MTYRAEVVGSLLRPTYLAEARKQFEAGQLDAAAFKAIEDRAVNEESRDHLCMARRFYCCPAVSPGLLSDGMDPSSGLTSMRGRTNTPLGQRRAAVTLGMAERTPNWRAS